MSETLYEVIAFMEFVSSSTRIIVPDHEGPELFDDMHSYQVPAQRHEFSAWNFNGSYYQHRE